MPNASAEPRRVFVAGASGAVGQPLVRLLVADGWQVVAATRTPAKAALLQQLGAEPCVVDVFDAAALHTALRQAAPHAVIHQLTDLRGIQEPALRPALLERNAELRIHGTRNLIAAAEAAGVMRMVAQSIAFIYAPGATPHVEHDPLSEDASHQGTVDAVRQLEQQVLQAQLTGLVLRYGHFYGPGTGVAAPPSGGPVHVHAAADAARKALSLGAAGIYNIAEDDGAVSSHKARQALGWAPEFRIHEDMK
ncbi:MAG: NAD(P)H-binding protein [Anaerolineales bacterium]|jgi:nucleoside-diphosphate-sugar epimerase|nr:NAD(P)H-binding protein [Anaerolineales bacterium]MCW5887726.1 NAD(P)H-binding protein [Anaerolineales bacterium]